MPPGHEAMAPVFRTLLEMLDDLDIRSDATRFRQGLHYDGAQVLVGRGDRSVRITDGAKIDSQRVLPTVATGGRLSVQNLQPLSALSGTTQIDIASHTVQYGFGTVAYNGGSVTGLVADTLYYVYADDDEIAGGAVSYFAATDPQEVAAANGRYFVGSIKTPATADVRNVLTISQASPCVITLDGAGPWSDGNEITITGATGMTEINGLVAVVDMIAPGTAKLTGVDSRLWTAYTGSAIATRSASDQLGSGGASAGGGGKTVFLGTGF